MGTGASLDLSKSNSESVIIVVCRVIIDYLSASGIFDDRGDLALNMSMKSQLINIKIADLNQPVYRIVSCERFLSILADRKNGLVRPRKWEDPFENFILNAIAVASDGTKARIGYRDHVYGQCWSLHRETDLMWRAYSPKQDAVKLKTTIGQLLKSLYLSAGEYKDISCFVGKVIYLSKPKIKDVFDKTNITDSSGKGIAETLLVKRYAFRSEKEVRLIYFKHEKDNHDDVFCYDVEPNNLFAEAVLDPRMDAKAVNNWKEKLKKAGFKKTIFQSGLYKPPEQMFLRI